MHEYEEWQKSLGEKPNRVAEIVEVPLSPKSSHPNNATSHNPLMC